MNMKFSLPDRIRKVLQISSDHLRIRPQRLIVEVSGKIKCRSFY